MPRSRAALFLACALGLGSCASRPSLSTPLSELTVAELEQLTLTQSPPPRTNCSVYSRFAAPAMDVDTAALAAAVSASAAPAHAVYSVAVDTTGGIEPRLLETTLADEQAADLIDALFAAVTVPADTVRRRFRLRVDAGPPARVRVGPPVMCAPYFRNNDEVLHALQLSVSELRERVDFSTLRVTVVGLFIAADGLIDRTRVARSAGNTMIDAMAVNTLQLVARFDPALHDGLPVGVWVQVPVEMRVAPARR